jgi:putative ABC transport system permease protein
LDAVRRAALELDPDLPVLAATTLAERGRAALFPQRLAAAVTAAFGCFGVLIGAVGLYGLVSFFVERRRHELAVRSALGASRRDLRRRALWQGLRPVALGLAGGSVAALALGRVVAGFLPSVGGYDPIAFAAAALLLALVSWLAALLPARRASRTLPMEVLRAE